MRLRTLFPLALAAMLAAPSAASAAYAHTVGSGESLYSIAAADGLSVAQLAAANGLSPQAGLRAGATVFIPPQVPGARAAGVISTASSYCAGDGDSDDMGCSSERSEAMSSGLTRSVLPTTTTSVRYRSAAYSQPVGRPAEGSVTAPPYPTSERVSGSEIARLAAANGVPPSLAEAIAWQESGFNNALVSSADARGVMQILPGTWSWIQQRLTAGAPPLAPASAVDNVRGGVLMLHSLLRSTGGDPALAAAGYYQGLPSVRQVGQFPSTQHYVHNVLSLARRFGGG